MGRNRNAPSGLAKLNRHGVPWVAVAITFAVGLIVFLPFPSWQKLVGFITSHVSCGKCASNPGTGILRPMAVFHSPWTKWENV